jgi:uncharacterized protein YkwD
VNFCVRRQLSTAIVVAAACGFSLASQSSVAAASFPTAVGSQWLTEINYYREASGLTPVTNNSSWDAGIKAHLIYLGKTPKKYFTGPYQSHHIENPASPYYTAAGAAAGRNSDLADYDTRETPVEAIDGWLSVPFHSQSIFDPNLRQVAFVGTDTNGDAGLNVGFGVTGDTAISKPVLFPATAMTTNLANYGGGENPNPIRTCRWNDVQIIGLPLIAILPAQPVAGITATLTNGRQTMSTSTGDLCVVDQYDYVSPTSVYGPTGSEILSTTHEVFLIPKFTLEGMYTATLNQPGQSAITWNFTDTGPYLTNVVGMSATPSGKGYLLASSFGTVAFHGDASYNGSVSNIRPRPSPAGIASTPDGKGYWIVSDGGFVYCFGDAHFFGELKPSPTPSQFMQLPEYAITVGMASTPDGKGYWIVNADGGVFSFGDAKFYGSMGGRPLNAPIVGIAADSKTGGYWEVSADGGVFSFHAPFLGSTGRMKLNAPVVGMAVTRDGGGYWFVAADGGIFAFGDASFHGSMGGHSLDAPIVGMASDDLTGGYWLVALDGGIFSFKAPFLGSNLYATR